MTLPSGTCTDGAEPLPSLVQTSAIIQVAAIGATVFEFINRKWPIAMATQVLANYSATHLCDLNPLDPGDLTLDWFITDITQNSIPGPGAPAGSLAKWIFDKALYNVFAQNCRCKTTLAPPPPPIVVTQPTGVADHPTAPDLQPQLTRIENNQTTQVDGLTTLYHGLQLGFTDTRDMAFRTRSSFISSTTSGSWTMSGEGQQTLGGFTQVDGSQTQDVFGINVSLTAIPSSVKRRGTTYQRLYGVGSIEWNAQVQSSYPHTIVQRDSIHYEHQFILAPQYAQVWTVRWRLQPGVQATGVQVLRAPDTAIYAPTAAYAGAYEAFENWQAPPNWSDSPFYPQSAAAARRVWALGGG